MEMLGIEVLACINIHFNLCEDTCQMASFDIDTSDWPVLGHFQLHTCLLHFFMSVVSNYTLILYWLASTSSLLDMMRCFSEKKATA